ncbi:MAG: hypothetical protein F4Z77_11825 [Dehalococcoidia bacterium]|nr:hypothetical protein [Dehalococcoidia bacterium]MYA52553.1 hypothetical protein [Dehalococcoidia bacterium]
MAEEQSPYDDGVADALILLISCLNDESLPMGLRIQAAAAITQYDSAMGLVEIEDKKVRAEASQRRSQRITRSLRSVRPLPQVGKAGPQT